MKISAKTEYTLLALVDLAEQKTEDFARITDISTRKNIPKKFLEQILLTLKRSGYVRSRRGSEGGYRLAKDPSEITLAEVIRIMDGALAPVESVSTYFYEHTPIEQDKRLLSVFKEIRDYVAQKLETTTLRDIINNEKF